EVKFPFNKSKQENTFTFESGRQKMQFNVICNRSFIECETWNSKIIEELKEGDVVRMTNYIPSKSSWISKQTGAKQFKSFINVEELIILQPAPLRSDLVLPDEEDEKPWELALDDDKRSVHKVEKKPEEQSLDEMLEGLEDLM
ncbi:MAG: hypothetical protein ACRC63_00985, partial [Metamycoplasmataceae bacterium]